MAAFNRSCIRYGRPNSHRIPVDGHAVFAHLFQVGLEQIHAFISVEISTPGSTVVLMPFSRHRAESVSMTVGVSVPLS